MIQIAKRLLITGGGTGGHIFPGLAVAQYLMRKNGWKVFWLGSFGRLEGDIVPKYDIEIKFIHAMGFCGKNWCSRAMSLLFLFPSILKALSIMRNWKPDIVLSVGGYVSISVGIAAWICGYPLIVHEQNSIPGLANRCLAKTIARNVLQGFPGAFSYAETVGNPIRDAILSIRNPEDRLCNRTGPIRLLIMGGSQGSQIFNRMLPKIISMFFGQFLVWHQVGKGRIEEVFRAYGSSATNVYRLVEFIDDIASAYSWADMVICRSGALTVSEISIVGLAAIFVPFAHKDCHQYWNAFPLQQIGAAKIVREQEFTIHGIARILSSFKCRLLLLNMAKRARLLSVPDATERVASKIVKAIC